MKKLVILGKDENNKFVILRFETTKIETAYPDCKVWADEAKLKEYIIVPTEEFIKTVLDKINFDL